MIADNTNIINEKIYIDAWELEWENEIYNHKMNTMNRKYSNRNILSWHVLKMKSLSDKLQRKPPLHV